jgi:hypothetical protein
VALLLIATLLASGCGAESEQQTSKAPPEVVGSTLRARADDGSILEGAELVGAELKAEFEGRTVTIRIDSVERDTKDAQGDLLLYDFRVVHPSGSEEPLCDPDGEGRRLGFPIAGEIDKAGIFKPGEPNDIALVCLASAQGKCVRMGYAPWRKAPDGRSMLDWHQSCIRLMRADYCGDGDTYTRNGTIVDIYDRIDVQKSDGDPSLSFEAAWGPDGAVCVARTRIWLAGAQASPTA